MIHVWSFQRRSSAWSVRDNQTNKLHDIFIGYCAVNSLAAKRRYHIWYTSIKTWLKFVSHALFVVFRLFRICVWVLSRRYHTSARLELLGLSRLVLSVECLCNVYVFFKTVLKLCLGVVQTVSNRPLTGTIGVAQVSCLTGIVSYQNVCAFEIALKMCLGVVQTALNLHWTWHTGVAQVRCLTFNSYSMLNRLLI